MASCDDVCGSDPLILEEMAACLEPDGQVEVCEFRRVLRLTGADKSKRVELALRTEDDRIVVAIEFSKVRSEGEHRNVAKYLASAKARAVSKLSKATLTNVEGIIGQSRLTVRAQWPLADRVSRKDIGDVCQMLADARNAMTLG